MSGGSEGAVVGGGPGHTFGSDHGTPGGNEPRPGPEQHSSTRGRAPRGRSFIVKHRPMLRLLHSSHSIGGLFVRSKLNKRGLNSVVGLTGSHGVRVRTMPGDGLSALSSGTIRRNIVTTATTFRCTMLSSLFRTTTTGGRSPFFVVLSNIRSPRGLKSILHATSTYNTRKIVVPGHHTINLATAITGTSANTVRRMPIIHIAGLRHAVRRLGRHNI